MPTREDDGLIWIEDWEVAFDGLAPTVDFSQYRHCKQHKLNSDQTWIRAVIGTRRSGKSEELCMEGIETAEMFPGETIPYILPTIGMGRDIVFPKMEELDEKFKIGLKINRGEFKVETPSGGIVQLFGLSTLPEAEKGRGKRFPLVIVDESGAHNQTLLKRAVTETFGPATADFRGIGGRGILLGGTPGYEPDCYWERLCGGNTHISKFKGVSVHFMDIFDNPFFTGREQIIIDAYCAENGLKLTDAKVSREWKGQFCADTDGLCYQRWPGVLLPQHAIPTGGYTVLGLDLGTVHPCAWVVVRFVVREVVVGDNLYSIHHGHVISSYEESNCSMEKIVGVTRAVQQQYNVTHMVGDSAGSMAPTVIRDLRVVYGLPIEPVHKKGSKAARIWMTDSQLGAGTLHIHEGAPTVNRQLKSVPWNADKSDHHEKFPDHSLDALHGALSLSRQHEMVNKLPPRVGSVEWDKQQREIDLMNTVAWNDAGSRLHS